ncbi:hypothetical protein RclHR1_07990002 [Rhizophagus clarus]|uniref:Peptidase S1 domain-containing protein n=1 Tax=Rhizophagus clarus TaxID=94130 RepID=A0A2Z6RYS5_9GLOM|nr:hypothetical protein RclHR1_07990002 [Rhizophagus clarus]GES98850.1 hypothetical protein GLOIN_2v1551520 [Rhizophagus clarus]
MLPHRKYQNTLVSGISIGMYQGQPSASTLGPFFKTDAEPGKKFILTVSHAVGGTGSDVIQPGSLDELSDRRNCCAVVSRYNFHGVDDDNKLLDYAFCEITDERKNSVNNRPFHTNIDLAYNKHGVSGTINSINCVQKVGRKTAHTYGLVYDKYKKLFHEGLQRYVQALIVEPIDKHSSSKIYNNFGDKGDSGAPVFDENGCLWGIFQGIKTSTNTGHAAVIVPIHLILNHVKKEFNVDFQLI